MVADVSSTDGDVAIWSRESGNILYQSGVKMWQGWLGWIRPNSRVSFGPIPRCHMAPRNWPIGPRPGQIWEETWQETWLQLVW